MFNCRNTQSICGKNSTAQTLPASWELQPLQEHKGCQGEPQLYPCTDGGPHNLAMTASSEFQVQGQPLFPAAPHSAAASVARMAAKVKINKFRTPLKLEDGEYKTANTEYKVEIPVRAALRIQNLMQSTQARLNDEKYNDRLHKALLEQEANDMGKLIKARELSEKNRFRNLVIDGKMEPNEETKDLLYHPVFRVNRMLKRLEMQDATFNSGLKVTEEITPVEPYEFDGNRFFKHLHEEGTYWVPSSERIFQEEKLAGKIARAKLRLIEKRRIKAHQDKIMRTIYNANNPKAILELGLDYTENESPDVSKQKLKKLRETLTAAFQRQTARLRWKKAMLYTQENERKAREKERLRERNKDLIDERERARQLIIDKYRARLDKFKTSNHHKRSSERETEEEDYIEKSQNARKASSTQIDLRTLGSSSMDFTKILALPATPPDYFEEETVRQIRKVFNLRDNEPMDNYKPYMNPFVEDHMNKAKNADELFLFGNELKDLYLREQEMANDLVRQLNKIYS